MLPFPRLGGLGLTTTLLAFCRFWWERSSRSSCVFNLPVGRETGALGATYTGFLGLIPPCADLLHKINATAKRFQTMSRVVGVLALQRLVRPVIPQQNVNHLAGATPAGRVAASPT